MHLISKSFFYQFFYEKRIKWIKSNVWNVQTFLQNNVPANCTWAYKLRMSRHKSTFDKVHQFVKFLD